MIRKSTRVRTSSKAKLWKDFAFLNEIDFLENVQGSNGPTSQKERKSRLVEDFLIPALNYKTYGDLLMWDPVHPSCFLLSWTHKAASAWSLEQAAVFAAWDEIKGRPVPKNRLDFVYSKQRMRAALKAAKNIEGVKGVGGYRRYKILNLDNYEVKKDFELNCKSNGDENIPNNTQLLLKEDFIFEDYDDEDDDAAGSPEPPETVKRKRNPSEKQDSAPEKQKLSEVAPYHRHTRSLTQKIVEICPDSKATLFEEIDDMPKIRKKYPPKRSVQQAFNGGTNGAETLTESTEDCTLPKKKKPPSPKKRKRRVRRFTIKKKPPSKNYRKWKRPKKTVKINIKEYSIKNRKVFRKPSTPLQYSVLENESLYWKTLDQLATQDIKHEPSDNFTIGVSEKSRNHKSPVENEQIVPESTVIKISSEAVLNSSVKEESMEYVSEEHFFSPEAEEESEYESEPPSPASDPDTSINASQQQDQKGSGHSLIRDFVIPALDNETYGDLLHWDSSDPSVFWIKWTHKAKSSWSQNDAAVFIGWDKFKGRRTPNTPLDFVDAKQRLRAAFRNLKTVEHVQMKKGYRGYRIFALAGVESIRERKISVQKYLKAAQEMEEAYCKSQAAAKPKLKDPPFKPKLKTKPKLKDDLKRKENSSSASSNLNSSELLDSYHHHTRSLTRKMVDICPSPKTKRQFHSVFKESLKLSTSEEKENIAQTSKIPKTPTHDHKIPVHEINSTDIYHDIHLIRMSKPSVRYEDTHDTKKEAHPVSNFNNSSSYDTDSPADNSEVSSESSDWEPGSKRDIVRKPRITKHAVDPKDFPLMAKSRKTYRSFRSNSSVSKQRAHVSSDSLLFKALMSKRDENENSARKKHNLKRNRLTSCISDSDDSCKGPDSNECSEKTHKKHVPSKPRHAKRSKDAKKAFKSFDCSDLDDGVESESFDPSCKRYPTKQSKRGKSSVSRSSSDTETNPKSRKKHKKIKNNQSEVSPQQECNVDPFLQYENIIKSELQKINNDLLGYSDLSDALSSFTGSDYTDESLDEEEVQNFMREKIKARILNSEKPLYLNNEKEYISLLPQCSVSLKRDSVTDNRVNSSVSNCQKGSSRRKKQPQHLKAKSVEQKNLNMNENYLIVPPSIPDCEDPSKKNLLMEFSYFVDEYNRKNALVASNKNEGQVSSSDSSSWGIKIVDICSIPDGTAKTVDEGSEVPKLHQNSFCVDSTVAHEKLLQPEQANSVDRSVAHEHLIQSEQNTNFERTGVQATGALKLCNSNSLNEVNGEVLNCEQDSNSVNICEPNSTRDADHKLSNFNPNSSGRVETNETSLSMASGARHDPLSSNLADFSNSEAAEKDDESDVEVIEILVKDTRKIHMEKGEAKKDSILDPCSSEESSIPGGNDSIRHNNLNKSSESNTVRSNMNLENQTKENFDTEASEPNAFIQVKNLQVQQTESSGSKNIFPTAEEKMAELHIDERLQDKMCSTVSKREDMNLSIGEVNEMKQICSQSQNFKNNKFLLRTGQSPIHREILDDCEVLQLPSETEKSQNHVNFQSLHCGVVSSSKNNNETTSMCIPGKSLEAKSFENLEDDCLIVNHLNVCSTPSRIQSELINDQQSRTHSENFSSNGLNVNALSKGKCEVSHCTNENDTISANEPLNPDSENSDDECMIVNDKCSALIDKNVSQVCNETIENCAVTSNRNVPEININSDCSVQYPLQKSSTIGKDQAKIESRQTEILSQENVDPDSVEDDCIILSDVDSSASQNSMSKNLQTEKQSQYKPGESTVFQLLNAYKKECLNYQKLIQTVNVSDSEIKLAMDMQAERLELISRLVENSIGTLNPCPPKPSSNSSISANETVENSKNQMFPQDKHLFPKLISFNDPKFHLQASSRLNPPCDNSGNSAKQPCAERFQKSSLNSVLTFTESLTEDRTESACESSDGKLSEPWVVPKDAKCTVCHRPASSACFYCCVVYYCTTECAESPINRSHYEFCKDEYLSKLNVTKLHRPIAEKQPCL